MPRSPGHLWWLLRRAIVLCYEENSLSVSKGAAYSALLSMFPVLTTLAAILVQAKAGPVLGVLERFLASVAPPGTERLFLDRFVVSGERPVGVLILAVLVSLYAASGVMLSLMEGFDYVYHVPRGRPFLKKRGVAALLVFGSALPAVGASALILFGNRTELWVLRRLSDRPDSVQLAGGILIAGIAVRYAVAFATVILLTMFLYRIGPNRPQKWRNVWGGAVVATLLWLAATQGFAWYLRNTGGYNVMYGSIAAVIALIVWMYFLAVIALYGCAYNAAAEHLRATEASIPKL